jgi:hypothetical protein
MNGCLLAAIILGGVLLVGGIAVGVGIYAFVQSDVGQTTIKVVGATKRLADKGANAPGAAQLRSRGCDQAIVLGGHDFDELVSALDDGGLPDGGMGDLVIVSCQVNAGHPPPSCADLARTYVSAVGTASSDFVVTVQQQGNGSPFCRETYDRSGAPSPRGAAGTL